jgi:DNA-binding LacI/PurR family transcriptional regulator
MSRGRSNRTDISPPRAPTIIDVAARAGLSKSVVSRVMRGEASVSNASRAAVMSAAEELGYRANLVARSLVQRRTHNVGVVVSDLHNIFFAEVLDGLYSAAAQLGYRALITTGNRDPVAEQRALEQLLELRAEGVVLAGSRIAAEAVAAAARTVPIAVVGSNLRLPGVDVVVDDDFRGAALAVEHLVALGHRDVALIDGGMGAGAAERRAGYESTMIAAGLEAHVRIEVGDFTEGGGYEGGRRLLRGKRRPTAIFASNDQSAVGALNAINEAGLSVPDDVSLIGYDNTALAALRHISLTTIHQPRKQIGEIALKAVVRRIDSPGLPARRHVLAPKLVVRATTAPPRSTGARGSLRRKRRSKS